MSNKKLLSSKKEDSKEVKDEKAHNYTVDLLQDMIDKKKKERDEQAKGRWNRILKRK